MLFYQAVTDNTKCIVINFPNNPLGISITEAQQKELYQYAKEKKIYIISDDVFKEIYPANLPILFGEYWISLNGVSKSFGYPGLRLGWILADKIIINKALCMKEIVNVATNAVSQKLVCDLLKSGEHILHKNIICNMKKFKHDDIPPVEKENERDENYQGTNSKIDSTRTKNNIHLVKREQTYLGYINQRISELDCRTKKDTVLMCSMLVSASSDFFKDMLPEHIREYFAMCYRFFEDKYGKENIISAVVHMDETTPHMHLNLMPVLDGRLCCKHLFDRVALQKLQTDIYEQVWKERRSEKLQLMVGSDG